MKTLVLTILASICTLSLYAQNQYATTSDGKKVLLKSNGTWEYVKNNASTTNNLYSGGSKSTTTQTSSRTTNTATTRSRPSSARTSTGRTYIRGPRGGCYYINSNGNKTYVDRSLCN